jgi:hypothetical protein
MSMSISKYEAAAFYDWSSSHKEARYIVIDLDDCSYGLCSCGSQGETKLIQSGTSGNADLWEMCSEAVRKTAGDDYPFDISHEMQNQLTAGNDILYNYIISDRMLDAELLHFAERMVTCREFEELISEAKEKLDEMFSHINENVSKEILADSSIIVLGRAQQVFLITYYIKEYLCADPLLADERYRNIEFSDSYDNIVKIGTDLYESGSRTRHGISLRLYDKETGSDTELMLPEKNQNGEDLHKPEYIGPVLLTENDTITLEIDGEKTEIKVPYSFGPMESDLAELGIEMKGEQIVLNFRRCRFPSRIYSFEIG